MTNEYKKLLDLVGRMRDKQKLYFKQRDSLVLRDAKVLEREVDEVIAKHREERKDTQMGLFTSPSPLPRRG